MKEEIRCPLVKENVLKKRYFLGLCFCESHTIDEEYAALVVKSELSLTGSVSAQALMGGYSGAKLFAVISDTQKYVIRFSADNVSQEVRQREIYNFKVASDEGYGPHVYYTDPFRGILIMEYLSSKIITTQDLQLDQFYVA